MGSTGPAYTMQCHVSIRRCSISTVDLQIYFNEVSCLFTICKLASLCQMLFLNNPLGTGEALQSYMLMLLRGIRGYSSERIHTR